MNRESLGYSSHRILDYCPVDIHRESLGLFFSTGSRLLSVDSQGVAGLFFSAGSRLLFSRFTGSRWVILLNGFKTIVQQIHRESLGYSSQRILDYCPVEIHRESLGFFSQRVLDYCQVDSQGAAGLFFSMGSRQLSSRFTGSRWVILLNGFQTIVQQIFTGSRWVILLNGFQTIIQQIHRESPGYSSQRVLDYCSVDSLGVAGLFFSTGSRLLSSRYSQGVADYSSQRFLGYCPVEIHRESLGYFSQRILDYCRVDSQGAAGLFYSMGSRQLSSRFTGSRWVILLNGFLTIVQQIFTGSRWVILLNGFQTIVQQIHRESLGYSSQRVLDYCPVDSQGVAGLFFSTGSRLLSSRFTGSPSVILLNGFQTIVKQIHRESLGYSSQRVLDNCPVDSQEVAGLFFSAGSRLLFSSYSQGVARLFFSTGSRLLSSRFTGSRWVIFLNGFKTIVQQMNRESLGYSSQRILDYCPVDIHRESLGYSSQRVLDYCQQIHRESPGYSSQRVLDYCSVDSQGVAGLFFSMGSRLLSSRFTGSRWVILLNGFKTIVILLTVDDSQGVAGLFFSTGSRLLSSRYSQGVAGLFFSTGSRLLSSRFTGSRWDILLNGFWTIVQQIFTGNRWVILLNGFQTIVKQIHRGSLVILLNGFLTIVQQRFTGSHWVILLNGFKTIVQQIHRESRGYSSQRVLDYCPVDSQEVAGLFFPTGSRLLSSRFSGSRWVILLNGFQTIVKQIHRESLGYASQRVQDYCPVDSQGVAGLYFSTGSRLLFSRFTGHAGLFFPTGSRLLSSRDSQGVAGLFFSTGSRLQSGRYSQGVVGLFFSTGSRLLSSRFTGSRWVILLNGFKTIVQQILRESLGYTFQRVIDYCPEYSRESLGYSSQRVLDYCPVDSQGVAGIFYSTGSGLLSSRYSQGIAGLFFSTVSRLLSSRFTGSRWLFFSTVS